MKQESLERAVEINDRLMQLEIEKDALIDILPPTQEALKERNQKNYYGKRIYGRIQSLFRKENGKMSFKGLEYKLEVTNDDVMAMYELRKTETERLIKELETL